MIDDLVTQGTEEPYRMFTSRAEHRLLLGCDSVYVRLSPIASQLGIMDEERRRRVEERVRRMQRAQEVAEATPLRPDRDTLGWLGASLGEKSSVAKLMQRHDFQLEDFLRSCPLEEVVGALRELTEEEAEGVISRIRYAGYIERQQREAAKVAHDEALQIPGEMSYRLPGLSREMVEKLSFVRPASLAQAGRIPGVTPAAVAILRMHLRRGLPAAVSS
jgi:tRNA uridine 5-carboxymethylaminomethyl modification enzyme